MSLTEILRKEAVILRLEADDRFQAIRLMIQHLVDIGLLDEKMQNKVENEVIEREKILGTGLENGVAVPHALIEGIQEELGVFARCVRPIDFSFKDEIKSDLIFLLIVPLEPVIPHVRRLSQIVKILYKEEVRKRIRAATTIDEIYEVFT
ncbi:MAG: PTS sugar transporter subunit IIA [FCB group bacterium]|nr:PTS sugar transporter subunit IIA [FCB group bacterium]